MAPTNRSKTMEMKPVEAKSSNKIKHRHTNRVKHKVSERECELVPSHRSFDHPVDWMNLFPITRNTVVTPRMAYSLYEAGVLLADAIKLLELYSFDDFRLPGLARFHYKGSQVWNKKLAHCFLRLCISLEKGEIPTPRCVGEVVALKGMINVAKRGRDTYGAKETDPAYLDLEKHHGDNEYDTLRDMVFDSDCITILKSLYGENEDDSDDDDDDDVSQSSLSEDDESIQSEDEDGNSNTYTSVAEGFALWLDSKFERNAVKFGGIIQSRGKAAEISYGRRNLRNSESSPTEGSMLLNLHPNRWFLKDSGQSTSSRKLQQRKPENSK